MGRNIKNVLLLIGSFIGINITYILSGLLYQKLAKNSYYNIQTNRYDRFHSSIGYCLVLRLIAWLLSQVYTKATLKKQEYVVIDKKYSFVCGLIIVVSSISFMESLYLISYPFIMMAKSSSVLQIALMGVFCTQMKDKKQKIGKNKIITSFIVTLGVILFKVFDPETSFQSQISRQTELLGVLILLINLCADCFLPDFQAQIKYHFKPKSAQMLTEINRWSLLICLIFSAFTGNVFYTFNFIRNHPSFAYEIVALAVLTFIGQTFVYKIIKSFQKKFIPFLMGIRKTFTISVNLFYFGHRTSYGQIISILIAFSATIWQYSGAFISNTEIQNAKSHEQQFLNFQIQPSFVRLSNNDEQNETNQQKMTVPYPDQTQNNFEEQYFLRQT